MIRISPRQFFYSRLSMLLMLWLGFGLARLRQSEGDAAALPRRDAPATPVRHMLDDRLDSLGSALRELSTALAGRRLEPARAAFRNARRLYKATEFLLTYYAPTAAGAINGPVEADDGDSPPQALGRRPAFAVVEETLFGNHTAPDFDGALSAARKALATLQSFRAATHMLDVSDTASLDAARLEMARVMTLGVAGYDSDESGDAVVESASALDGVASAIPLLQSTRLDSAQRARVVALLRAASADLRAHESFDNLDRFGFIATRTVPAARAILALRRELGAGPPALRRLWRPAAATPFDSGAFDVSALAPEYAPRGSPDLVALGARLFADSQLSGPRNRSCASCHQPARAFADGQARPVSASGVSQRLRNTPTLLNAALQQMMFADQRSGFVEDQIRVVLSSGAEMASAPELAARRVAADSSYILLVRRASPAPADERLIRVALAAYVRSLIALDAPFDRAIRGDTAAITPSARRGFNLFMGKARCGTCHFAPLFGGTLPPDFTRSELEIIGAPTAPLTTHARVDDDAGRARVDGAIEHRGAFRVPSVRNSAVTAPYMHNGAYRSLDDVVDFYDRGGGIGIGESLPAQTLSSRPLHLTPRERADVVSFLRSLTDTVIVVAKP